MARDRCIGTIHPTVAARYGLSGEILAAELRMDALLAAIDPRSCTTRCPSSRLPPVILRFWSTMQSRRLPCRLLSRRRQASCSSPSSCSTFTKGKGIPDGKKSVAYSLSMRAPDRTPLTDEECDKAMRAAISALETEFGAQLRG